jgi:hypothetical protein
MAHFAEIDSNNKVLRVITVDNSEILDNGQESETKGIAFCVSLFGGTWLQTSYSGSIRKNYAGEEYIYDPVRDAFIHPEPLNATGFDEDTCQWIVPEVNVEAPIK